MRAVDERRTWELGNPLSWPLADRCLALALLMFGATAVVIASTLAGGWPWFPARAAAVDALVPIELGALGGWIAIAAVSRRWRQHERVGYGLAIAVVVLFTTSLALFTLATGPFAAPGWIAYLGGAVVGYVLLPRVVSLSGVVAYAALVIAGAALIASGRLAGTTLQPLFAHVELDGAAIVRGACGCLALFALTFSVIAFVVDRWRKREAGYEQLASTDVLTGLTNRRRFLELALREVARARRYASPLALVIVDLDHFKSINDRHGHSAGDQALAFAANVLRGAVRDVDVIARYGGEEFAVLLPATDEAGAAEVAERCRRRLADSTLVIDDAIALRITASLGVAAEHPSTDVDVDALLRRADAALYRAKAAGRDRVELA